MLDSGVDLLRTAAELVAIPSVSLAEANLADHVEAALRQCPGLEVVRVGHNVVGRTHLGRATRVILAGHLDTVPPAGNSEARVEGDVLSGLGAADMKGGLAVMLELARTVAEPAVDVSFVFYAAEEIARRHNGLLQLVEEAPDLLQADVAILGEPTGAAVEAGCQGVLRFEVTLRGQRAHVARPWMGVNAIHRAAPLLAWLSQFEPREPVVGGCTFKESLQAVSISGGVSNNVLPDSVVVGLSYRFAPDLDVNGAESRLRQALAVFCDPQQGDEIRVVDSAPAAPPGLEHPVLASLVAASGRPVSAKLAWTDVALFAERGVPAANFGPADPALAHRADERVTRADLEAVYSTLKTVLEGPRSTA